MLKTREANDLRVKLDQAELRIKNLEADIQNSKNSTEELRRRSNDDQTKASTQ